MEGTPLRQRLTYANVMATVAVFLALGGGAVAALKLKRNSVGSRQIKPNAVQGIDANESSFGQVPSAANADSAANAANAANALNADNAANAANALDAANAANADLLDNLDSNDIGLGFFSGRVKDLSATGTTGSSPSGVSASVIDTDLADQNVTLSPNRTIVMRNLSVVLTQQVGCSGICGAGENVTVSLEALVGGSVTTSITCSILTLAPAASCSAAGPSAVVPASSVLRLNITKPGDSIIAAGTDALFSWRATAP